MHCERRSRRSDLRAAAPVLLEHACTVAWRILVEVLQFSSSTELEFTINESFPGLYVHARFDVCFDVYQSDTLLGSSDDDSDQSRTEISRIPRENWAVKSLKQAQGVLEVW